MVAIPVPKRIHMLGLVASDLAVGDAGLGLLGAAGCAGGETPALVETVGTHEAAQRRIGRHRLEIRLRLGQRDEIVVMQLDAPALVGGVCASTARRTASLTVCCCPALQRTLRRSTPTGSVRSATAR